jgi:hypothetical protein
LVTLLGLFLYLLPCHHRVLNLHLLKKLKVSQ